VIVGVTPIYGFPYPALTDSPNGPAQIQALAEAVEADLAVTDAAVAALNAEVHFGDGGTYPNSTQNTAGTTTSGVFTNVLTGGTTCSLTFVAPVSGRVDIHNTAQVSNNTAGQSAIMSHEVRVGAVVGSGAVIQAAAIATGILAGNAVRATVVTPVTGLISGTTYNVQQFFVVTGGTGDFGNKQLFIRPAA
jgi:hypothetical protein